MKNMFSKLRSRLGKRDIDDLLEEIQVVDSALADNFPPELSGWFAVTTDEEIIAYVLTEEMAYKLRLDLINIILNT